MLYVIEVINYFWSFYLQCWKITDATDEKIIGCFILICVAKRGYLFLFQTSLKHFIMFSGGAKKAFVLPYLVLLVVPVKVTST